MCNRPTDLLNLPIKTFDGTVVVLQDVAEVRRTFQDRTRFALYNGRPAITIEVVKRQGTNIIETNDEVKRVAEDAAENLAQRHAR